MNRPCDATGVSKTKSMIRPKLAAGVVQELGYTTHATFEDVTDAQFLGNLPDLHGLALVNKRRVGFGSHWDFMTMSAERQLFPQTRTS
jgi:hypothetical protein